MNNAEKNLMAVGMHPSQGGWTQEEWNKQTGDVVLFTDAEIESLNSTFE